ncbi:DUF4230 domain-containing protein [Nonlabens mediterrranea]|uniref:DUF4230 domain-containing protein n=1 Tax=Nonlabens mediterrranea TaxID=1419947 RepID=A0ABS0A8F8_9FLAO|nr:DUF4230 domain-containing protein [Nonlabens mediterrranea]
MKNLKILVLGALMMLAIILIYDYIKDYRTEQENLIAQTELIEKEVRNVSKLIVTEVNYGKVYTYENSKSYGWDFFASKKKALVVSNAKAQVIYDLKNLEYSIDSERKEIVFSKLPDAIININPNLNFYQLDNGILNTFEAKDFNSMKQKISKDIERQIRNSDILKNADDRLLLELTRIFVLSNSLGWTVVYNGKSIENATEITDFLD